MSKLLSIIIPTYNMEALLPRCLDSLLVKGALDRIEAMVVNDGSKDGSLAVANSYKERFRDSVTVIDKPNGNYGSTINAALPVAKGKFVKILDSDDWFDSDSLVRFLDKLESTDTDMVITHFSTINEDGSREITKYNVYGKEPYEYGRAYNLDEVLKDGYIRFFLMHGLTYHTQMLKDMGYRQTEGISYTDTEWSCYPVFRANDITFLDINLYQYNLAREGQTMDPKVIAKSLDQMQKMTLQLISFYSDYDLSSLSETRLAFIKQYYANRIRLLYKNYLMDIPYDAFKADELEKLDAKLIDANRQFGFGEIRLFPANKILRFDALKYWHKHHKRWPGWFDSLNRFTDKAVNIIFVKLFKKK